MKTLGTVKAQDRRRSRWGIVRPALGVVLLSLTHAAARADEYRLGVQDKVRIKVIEWRAAQETVHEWVALSGEFLVGASGTVSLPLVGEVPAAGARTDELAQEIGQRLKSRVGLVQVPTASVEVVQFRPFYVLGRVERPGEYPYRPGLSVLQAVSIAGGLPRVADPALMRLDREIVSAQGGLDILKVEIQALIARRARLEAELGGSDVVKFPRELTDQAGDDAVARILREEQLILKGRQDTLRTQTEALKDLKTLVQNEISALDSKLSLKDRQLSLIRRELESVGALVSKGLAIVPRQFSLERAEAEIEAGRLELQTALLKARQDVSRTERDMLELRTKRHIEVLAEIRETQAKLEEANRKLSTAQTLFAESQAFGRHVAQGAGEEGVQMHFSIVRRVDGNPVETGASETSPVEPGDLVKVWITKQPPGAQVSSPAPAEPSTLKVTQAP